MIELFVFIVICGCTAMVYGKLSPEALVNVATGRKSGASFGEFRQMVKAMNWSNVIVNNILSTDMGNRD